MEEAQRLCDEILIADRGRVVARGKPAALVQKQFPASVIRLPLTAWPQGRPIPKDGKVRNGYIELYSEEVPPILETLKQAGADLGELRVETPNLEDLFLKLTGHALRS
jgi:ABC-2 type transport system ATP-binding protein